MGGAEVQIRGAKATTSISGNIVQISGQCVCTSISGNIVQVSGQTITTNISGQSVIISGQPVTISGNIVQISGQSVSANVSGQSIVIGAPANPVLDYNTATNIGAGASNTHTYITTGNFNLTAVEASASGAMKVETKSGTSGSEIVKMVAFTTESNLTVQLEFHEELQLNSGQRVLVIRTNREHQAMDVFSTILGFNT